MVNLTTLAGAVGAAVAVGLGASEIKSRHDHVATIQDAIGNPYKGQELNLNGTIIYVGESTRVRGYESAPVIDYVLQSPDSQALYHFSTHQDDKFTFNLGDDANITGEVANYFKMSETASALGVQIVPVSSSRLNGFTQDKLEQIVTLNYVSQNK